MAKEVRLPQLGQTMEEGTIVSCLIKEGDEINKGDVLFEIETDKATLEMESPAEGFVKKVLAETGQTLPINAPLLVVGDKDEVVDEAFIASLTGGASAPAPSASAEPQAAAPAASASSTPAPASSGSVQMPDSVQVVRLPQLGQTMEEGTITSCLIKEGDEIKKGDVLFEVETDKATLEMESPAEGHVKEILVEVGETIPINQAILILADKGVEITQELIDSLKSSQTQTAAPASAPQATQPAPAPAPVASAPAPAPAAVAAASNKTFASPRAKLVAKELGVDISTVKPAAGALRITEADVRKASSTSAPAASSTSAPLEMPTPKYKLGEKIKISRMQKIVGDRMLQSKQTIPCFYLNVIVDATNMFALRSKLNKTGDVKISFNDFIIKAVGMGLKHYPVMTGQIAKDSIQLAETIDVGLAISVADGLVAPLSRQVDVKSLSEIAQYNKALIERAKGNKLMPDDLMGGSITVSNLGGFGIDSFIPIVVPGQCSILGVGKITDTCVPMDGNIMVRKMMNMNLSVDHKVANGADAAQFLDFVKKLLENPSNLI